MLRLTAIFSILYIESIALRSALGPQWSLPTPENFKFYGVFWFLEYEGGMLLLSAVSGSAAILISFLLWGRRFLVERRKFLGTALLGVILNFLIFHMLNFLVFKIT